MKHIMQKEPLSPECFQAILNLILNAESNAKKLEILKNSKGFFNGPQLVILINSFKRLCDKVEAIRLLEERFTLMTCEEAARVIDAFSVHNDKLLALESLKRALKDAESPEGQAAILASIPYEPDRFVALQILSTVMVFQANKIAAGGHQGYAPCGGLFTQSKPLDPHVYGSVPEQMQQLPGRGAIKLPETCTVGQVPSYYTGHPSYAYKPSPGYTEARGYPGARGFPEHTEMPTAERQADLTRIKQCGSCGAPAAAHFKSATNA
jgi:hypothetical protein